MMMRGARLLAARGGVAATMQKIGSHDAKNCFQGLGCQPKNGTKRIGTHWRPETATPTTHPFCSSAPAREGTPNKLSADACLCWAPIKQYRLFQC